MRKVWRDLAAHRGDRAGQGVGNDDRLPGQVDALQLRRCIVSRTAACCSAVSAAKALPNRGLGDVVLGQRGEAHQMRGGVVLAEIGAHAVEAAVIHQVGFLKAGLAGDDVVGGHQDCAAGTDEAVGLRRRAFVGQHRRPGEQREADDGDNQQPI